MATSCCFLCINLSLFHTLEKPDYSNSRKARGEISSAQNRNKGHWFRKLARCTLTNQKDLKKENPLMSLITKIHRKMRFGVKISKSDVNTNEGHCDWLLGKIIPLVFTNQGKSYDIGFVLFLDFHFYLRVNTKHGQYIILAGKAYVNFSRECQRLQIWAHGRNHNSVSTWESALFVPFKLYLRKFAPINW